MRGLNVKPAQVSVETSSIAATMRVDAPGGKPLAAPPRTRRRDDRADGTAARRATSLRAGAVPGDGRRRPHVARLGQRRLGPRVEHARLGGVSHPTRPDRRLADLHRLRLDADVRPGHMAALDRRPGGAADDVHVRAAARAPAREPDLDVPLRHRLDGQERALGRRAHVRRAGVVAPDAGRRRAAVRLRREPVRRLSDDAAGVAARRDARLRDGREAAAARARRAAPPDDPGDVRLQEREVAAADQSRRRTGGGVLGAARVRPGRVGRPLERIRLGAAAAGREFVVQGDVTR